MGGKKKVGKKVLQQRLLADEENVYMIQNRWVEKGKFILLERDKNLLRLHRGLDVPHQGIRETQSEPIGRGSLPNSPRLRRPNNIVGRVRKFSRSLYASNEDNRESVPQECHSDGDISDEEENLRLRKTSMANLRKLKIW